MNAEQYLRTKVFTTIPARTVITEARLWVKDCAGSFRDIDDDSDVDRMADLTILRGVQRSYDGGLAYFVRSIEGIASNE